VKHWDAIIIGAGIIGLSVAIELSKRGLKVLIVDKGEPGREASWAAGGMLVEFPLETPAALGELAAASARMHPEFVRELEDESRMKIDLRDKGAIVFVEPEKGSLRGGSVAPLDDSYRLPQPLLELEPALDGSGCLSRLTPQFLRERSVDPRQLTAAAIAAAKHRGIDFSSRDHVQAVETGDGKVTGVCTSKTRFAAGIVVNCAGAWAGQIDGNGLPATPTRPVKGQMLCVVMPHKEMIRHVIRTPEVYLIPRSDGRLLIGATQEEAGFDKQTVPETIQKLRQAALDVVPKLADALILEAWAGLRPGTPDALPILGGTSTRGYFIATGHFRDGILLAPVTARVMGQVISGHKADFDLGAFGVERFGKHERRLQA
jgi:glycine oxidase